MPKDAWDALDKIPAKEFKKLLLARQEPVLKDRNKERKSQNVLTNNTNGGIIKENIQKPITPITDNAINKVPLVSVDDFTNEQNTFIQNQHKDLLKYARDNNDNKEVAFVFRKNLTDKSVFVGGDDVIDFGNGLFGKGDSLFIMHNHPRNSSFSNADITQLIMEDTIKHMSIAKNNGMAKSNKYLCEKRNKPRIRCSNEKIT